jgi:hypothetical protein
MSTVLRIAQKGATSSGYPTRNLLKFHHAPTPDNAAAAAKTAGLLVVMRAQIGCAWLDELPECHKDGLSGSLVITRCRTGRTWNVPSREAAVRRPHNLQGQPANMRQQPVRSAEYVEMNRARLLRNNAEAVALTFSYALSNALSKVNLRLTHCLI